MMYDVGIIGLGPAGYKFAQLALSRGLKVVCFEKNFCGGTCLNVGCVPTKAILHDAEGGACDWEAILSRKSGIVEKFRRAVEKDLVAKGAELVFAEASVVGGIIHADGKEFETKHIIVATGSKPLQIKGLEFDGKFILSSDDLFGLSKAPKSITVVGSGAIGVEWARVFSALGAEVTVIEKASSLLPASDLDVSKRLERLFKVRKIKFYKDCEVLKIEGETLALSNGETLMPERVLVAVGRESVKLDFGADTKNIFEIGDVGAQIKLAHYATAQAQRLFDHLYGDKPLKEISLLEVPSVVYGTPEMASIGLREQDLATKEDYKIHNLPVGFLAKAHCEGNIEGFIKIITDAKRKIVGAHIVSNEASALITQIAILMKFNATIDDVRDIIFPHPTLSEGIFEALHL